MICVHKKYIILIMTYHLKMQNVEKVSSLRFLGNGERSVLVYKLCIYTILFYTLERFPGEIRMHLATLLNLCVKIGPSSDSQIPHTLQP